ncbi:MAG: hypothetical protein WAM42_02145 [Candidatus Nitrosopolaris sp.]
MVLLYSITFSIPAIAAVTVLFASGPLVANQQVQAFPFGGGAGFGFFHHPFFFHHHF